MSFVIYIYRLHATQCHTEQLLKRFFDFLNVKIRVGKGEDFDYFEAASAAVVVGLSNIVGLINTNRTNF